jgi:hypothetical protein
MARRHAHASADGQGPKLRAHSSFFRSSPTVFGPPRVFMSELPLQFIRIGTFAVAAFPAELSTATGVMVRSQLSGVSPLVIVGLANEYTNYVTTPDEYGAQDYMAASTLWGPYEGPVFACRMQQLAASPYTETWSFERKDYSPGPAPEHIHPPMSFGPPAVGDRRAAPEDELERILLSARTASAQPAFRRVDGNGQHPRRRLRRHLPARSPHPSTTGRKMEFTAVAHGPLARRR